MDQKEEVKKPKLLGPLLVVGVGLALIVGSLVWWQYDKKASIDGFQACKDAGGRIAESYPEQCFIDDRSFINTDQITDGDNHYVGLPEQEALDKAGSEGKTARVVEREGESLPITMDLVDGRLNFSVQDGRVYKVHTESID